MNDSVRSSPPHNFKLEDTIELRQVWNILFRRKWGILGAAGAVGLLASLVAFAMTPIYRATATLLIEAEQANVVSIEEVYGLDTGRQEYFETQFEILKSRPLAENVVATLDLPDYAEFQQDESEPLLGFDWRDWLPFSLSTAPSAATTDSDADAIEAYGEMLSILPIGDTQLVEVRFESADPELAARIANEHAQAYIESMLDARVDVTESAAAWMAERLEVMQQELLESERKLQEFREREQLIDVEGLLALPSQEINDLSARLVEVRQTLAAAEIAYLQVANSGYGPSDLRGIPAILEDEGVRDFQTAEAEARRNVAELSERYGPLHPRMIAAVAELEEASANLENQHISVAEGIRNRYEAAQSEEQRILSALDRARADYQEVGRKESELRGLQRAADTNRQLYDLFYSRLSETSVAGDLQTAQARIITPAVVPREPARPNKLLIIGLSVVLTLMLTAGLALLLDSLENTVKGGADVEQKLQRPLLSTVPLLDADELSAARSLSDGPGQKQNRVFAETIRTIRTSISLDGIDKPHKIILVTSAVGSEGKSTIALNLARAFAATDRTLLIDADMRRPSLGKMLDLPRDHCGLSELLADKASLPESLMATDVENLDVMTTGFLPPDPLQLLASDRLSNALRVASISYGKVILDAPPILPVSDSAVLSRLVDSVVFVIKADETTLPQVRQGLDMLDRVDAPITGVVLNQLDFQKAMKYGDYGYGGYYGAYGEARA